MNITVYLGASLGNDASYQQQIKALGVWIAQQHHQLIYGGSKNGLMGILADTVLEKGGNVYGIIPEFFQKQEAAHQGLTHLQTVSDIDERKRLLMEKGDILLAFPGGPGTLEEISQAISWARMKQHTKPCLFFNMNGYYNHLKAHFDQMTEAGFLTKHDRDNIIFVDTLQELADFIDND